MDATYQNIHIYNAFVKGECVYRELRIDKISFGKDTIYIEYRDHNGIAMSMGIPKKGVSITID